LRGGVALKLEYDGITGTAVSNLTTDPSFPNSPTTYSVLTGGLEEPVNYADNFGAWTRGFIEAPQTGTYTFWIASDDDGEFWLSSNEQPANLVKVAENVGAVAQYAYTVKPAQQSAPISLVASHKYYFEMFHKEGGGNDHCSVAWMLPDGTYQNVLPSRNVWPFPVNTGDSSYPPITEAPMIITSYLGTPVDSLDPSGTTTAPDGQPLVLTVTIEASQPAYVQWFSNGVAIAGANLSTYQIPRVTTTMAGDVYSVTVTSSIPPAATASTTLAVTPDTTPPTLVDALTLGNPAGDVAVIFSEGVDPVSATTVGNYSINNGASVTSAVMSSDPAVALIRVTGMTPGTPYTLTVQNVQDLATVPNTLSPNPSSVVIEQGLHTWFRMDEATGTTANDSSGHGRNGTLFNGVFPDYTGKVQAAMKFDGVGGYIQGQNISDDFSTNGLTIALWAYPVDNLESWARFIDYANGAASDNILFARNGTSPDLTFEVYNGAVSGGQVTAPGAIALKQWQHFAVTMDTSGNVIIYKNGVALTNGVAYVPNAVARTNDFLGRSNWAQDGYYFGKMDDVRLYMRVLDPAAIAALAAGGGADDSSLPSVSAVATVPTTGLKNSPPGVFTLTRTGSTAASLTVLYTLGGTATNGVAYTNLSGSVTIPAGTNSAQVFVTPNDFAFSQLQQTVILTVAGNANYTIADANSGTVTIQNNDVAPAARIATAENAIGATPTKVDVWFGTAVTLPSATNLANYTLINAGGAATITNATLTGNRNLRVVLGVSGLLPTNALLRVVNVLDPGGNTASNQIPIFARVEPINVVANTYHGAANDRPTAFTYVSDGLVNNVNNGGTGFDTFSGQANTQSHFAGMTYPYDEDFDVIKVDLGQQFADGGDWQTQPSVYLLKNPVDTGSTRPETDTNNWVQVPANLISGSQFQTAVDPNPSPNTPVVFDLTGLPASQRHGYGWAVGGVLGNGTTRFISVSELRAYGYTGVINTTGFKVQPQDLKVVQGQRGTFVEVATNSMGAVFNYQWQKNGVNIAGATDVNYSIPPAALGDSGATFSVTLSRAVTSRAALLTVVARTTPPNLVAANLDAFNSLIDVWFDEPVDGNTAQNTGDYVLNDSGMSVYNAVTNANGYCVTLSYSGAPTLPNVTVTVSGVQDLFGHTMGSQATTVLPENWPVATVVANNYQQPRATCLDDSTNGVIVHATGDANIWETFEGTKNPNTSDFVGLVYPQAQVFGVIKVDLGWQFGDGGDWELQPFVYILKNPVDTNQRFPENDPTDWVQVPATLMSGNVFNYGLDGPVGVPTNTPIAFDLSHLPLTQRTGYGWAVGGVPANQAAHFLSITELRGFGAAATSFDIAGPPQVMLDLPASLSQPAGLPLTLTVYATGTQPINYQWKRNGVDLTDNSMISGSHSSVLTLAEAFVSDAGTYQLAMTNSAGYALSTPCAVTLTRTQPFNNLAWVQNGNNGGATQVPVISGTAVMLTDGIGNEDASVFLQYPQYISAFIASYTYQDVGGGGADGMAFVLQNDPRGPSALGGGGGGLGYSGITPSAALEFNLYGPNAPATTSSGINFQVNGVAGAPYVDSTPVNPAGGDPIGVTLRYDGTTLWLTLTDTVAQVSFSTNYVSDLPTLLGTNTAYVGITGADGGVASTQRISNFYFAPTPVISFAETSPEVLQVSWPASAGGLVLQSSPVLVTGSWTTVTNAVTLANGENQVQISPLTGTKFYRLGLP
jgi:Concanavalin A-like lectin/glucanases superfamily/PA14 domain/Bacterial lectin/Immunoglobulin I-set domain